MKKQTQSPNSLYRFGGIEILSISQDELSKLWKIYVSTPDHYLVSREFDRCRGLYANAPDDVVRQGLMDFSETLFGEQMSLWDIVDLFISRCFDDSVFNSYTENAVWMSIDYPSYTEVEEIFGTYSCRLKWFAADTDAGELINTALFRSPVGDERRRLVDGVKKHLETNNIVTVFMNHDNVSEKFLADSAFENLPVFIGEFSEDGDFEKFSYMKR